MKKPYTCSFYENQKEGSLISAREIVPLIIDLLHPKSVVDVGCGIGTWLKSFEENGVHKILGIDGPWINFNQLLVNKNNFKCFDLNKPININQKFDLAISLEVAEHLNKKSAQVFVESLTKMSDFILFSAAIPYQGGVNHLNESWQSYWANLFIKKDFLPVDSIRKRIWKNNKIELHYKQNTILYVNKKMLKNNKKILKDYNLTDQRLLDIVHPERHILTFKKIEILRKIVPQWLKSWVDKKTK